jgi:hypothetical protein
MADVKIDPESFLVLGLICRRPRWNEFNPGLLVDATFVRLPANQPTISGELKYSATEWGCPAVEFKTTRTFWDTIINVRARLRDAPLPVTVLGWQVELGNFSVGTAHFIDPRPNWSNVPTTIVSGQLALTGSINHPDPPIVAISGSSALGHLQLRQDVAAEATGDPDNGWQLRFRGLDGNFYVRLSLNVRDGDGTQWHGETFVILHGDQLELPPEYLQYKVDCDAKYSLWFRLKLATMGELVGVARVEPGEPVMSRETREAIAIRTLVAAGDPGALRHLVVAAKQFGSSVFRQIGQVSPAQVVPERGDSSQLR